MPHVILEYTDNLSTHIDIQQLVERINHALAAKSDTFPIGGIRVRAYKTTHYRIADGKENDAFVHAVLKIGKGRSEEEKKEACEAVFDTLTSYFEDYSNNHYLALSLELVEFQHATYKSNNIHQRFT
ncbi:5-carboxymethyl-2-hydroxymuconate isomerase [Thalassobacillus cyri]|uniref:5-carboxymethyl-2-hydroxymuconate isomerase n=1 Tax=Thalassobacillus cyri TaxID=571932 RepID=A0A1H4AD03_9BACI|nr:5-carboxymethyl-2-hydroxymuconate Delta-isomerase [Thalassobacillus cyri]SEA33859.1 5-carboxymethyl-2-hydroxymuconate isomerase [Thalassobacillus cyri]